MGKVVTLGEIMLRFSTQAGNRFVQSDSLQAHYGGGEANVGISLANYGHEVVFASKVPDTTLGEAVRQHLWKYHVDTRYLLAGGKRLGTYYLETGIGERSASVIYDRAGSSFAEMEGLEWDLATLFNDVDIFHISGITPALSKSWQTMTLELIKQARKFGCKVSFDINYRSKLWSQKEAGQTIRQLLPYVDYCSAGKLDAVNLLGIANEPDDEEHEVAFYYEKMQKLFPNIQLFYSTKRTVHSASANQLIGTLWHNQQYYESAIHEIDPIVDRVGAGDAFAGGILHGMLEKMQPQAIVDFATAAAALKHTVYGDCNQFSKEEVADFLTCGSGKIMR
ncbi:2-dehydro-3-deoxygluconokinase [Enterococcus silesiacus]|uniref:2-dehydro-3-deoxygluconokinase n=1 Tax=Enterococcus silesiacus TaxID=332949 RepID=A0A0S3KE20_9ENTE|nr:sugar kinase [Enterococcus silesiacus]ALS02520.1 2-dehydro-3-deoxygluconokinase [Enterococcus silesiacus]OJG93567.1 2-dehydro-3-deoxygluconokinase [Enterococcus silesiacus]